jgi:pyridoxamine 5'-phosphate oxidase
MHPLELTELEIRQRAWLELERATRDRHHEWRMPVLATIGKDGSPNARAVVLRHADAKLQNLQFYTDRRSPKIAELTHQPAAILVFWSERLNWQLRVQVSMEVLT